MIFVSGENNLKVAILTFFKITYVALVKASHNISSNVAVLPESAVVEQKKQISVGSAVEAHTLNCL
jgi:hypothetical protein